MKKNIIDLLEIIKENNLSIWEDKTNPNECEKHYAVDSTVQVLKVLINTLNIEEGEK